MQTPRLPSLKVRCMLLIAETPVPWLKIYYLAASVSMASIVNQLIARKQNALASPSSITVFHMLIVMQVYTARLVRTGLLQLSASNKEMSMKSANLIMNAKIINFAGTLIDHSRKPTPGLV